MKRPGVRALGVATRSAEAAAAFAVRAEARGLRTHVSAAGVAVAWDPAAHPAIGFAVDDSGSFVLLDGELFPTEPGAPSGTADAQAAAVLGHLRARGSLDGLHLEALVTAWDATSGRVTVARDAGGVVAGLLATVGDSVVWSSEPAALLTGGLRPEVDHEAVDQFVTIGWVAPPRWYLRGVTALPAGHLAELRPGDAPVVRAWFRHTARPALGDDETDLARRFGDAVTAAVARRSSGRLGAFLSAGVDSAMVVAVLRRTLGLPVETFTFHYHGYDGQLNEDAFAAETAKLLEAPHHTIDVRPEELAERFEEVVAAFQSPVSFGIHSFKQDAVAELGVDVVLGGSDPGFWHDHGRPGRLAAALRRLPASVQVAAAGLGRRAAGVPKVGVLHTGALLAVHGVMNEYLRPSERAALRGGRPSGAVALARTLADATAAYAGEPAARRTGFVFEQYAVPEYVGLWNLRWGRAHGYPVRAPLWDLDVLDVADRRPDWSGDKPVLRRFAATLLPRERAYAPKIYQEVPLGHWFRGPLRGFVTDALSAERVSASGLFEPAGVQAVLDDHLSGRADRRWPVWTMTSAVAWALGLRPDPEPLLPS